MQKATPSLPRVLIMVSFALSCFGLLLFLWLSFGGPIPLKAKGYRFKVAFPEAAQLGLEADVRVAGVSVGKVVAKNLDPRGNRTIATIELKRRFAPLRSDSRAILRQKTLLGETYVELTPGTKSAPPLPENGRLRNSRVASSTQLDEIFQSLDPQTRRSFQVWQQSLARAVRGRGQDLNDAFGNLPGFVADADDILTVLDSQSGAVRRLVRNTGETFGALSQDERQLHNLIVNSADVFSATASQNRALAETFRIFPTFLDESKRTMARLKTFSIDTDPLIQDLRQPTRDLGPTLHSVRLLAPDLRYFFRNLDPLITVSKTGLPALQDVLTGARPLLGELSPFLGQLNPILGWLEQNQHLVADFISQGANAIGDRTTSTVPGGQGHYLRQFGPSGPETVAMYNQRLPSNRGNTYLYGDELANPPGNEYLMWPNFDCNVAGVHKPVVSQTPGQSSPGCFVQTPPDFQGNTGRFLHVQGEDYTGKSTP